MVPRWRRISCLNLPGKVPLVLFLVCRPCNDNLFCCHVLLLNDLDQRETGKCRWNYRGFRTAPWHSILPCMDPAVQLLATIPSRAKFEGDSTTYPKPLEMEPLHFANPYYLVSGSSIQSESILAFTECVQIRQCRRQLTTVAKFDRLYEKIKTV